MDINTVIQAHTKKTTLQYKTRRTFKRPILTIQHPYIRSRSAWGRSRQRNRSQREYLWQQTKRLHYVGTFVRTGVRIYGSKIYMRKHYWTKCRIAIFKNVRPAAKNTSHGRQVWVPYDKSLREVGEIHKGDKLEFTAKIRGHLAHFPLQFRIIKRN